MTTALGTGVVPGRVTDYAKSNWTNLMIGSVSILRISRYHGLAVATVNRTRQRSSALG